MDSHRPSLSRVVPEADRSFTAAEMLKTRGALPPFALVRQQQPGTPPLSPILDFKFNTSFNHNTHSHMSRPAPIPIPPASPNVHPPTPVSPKSASPDAAADRELLTAASERRVSIAEQAPPSTPASPFNFVPMTAAKAPVASSKAVRCHQAQAQAQASGSTDVRPCI
jgi:hypothetical protein